MIFQFVSLSQGCKGGEKKTLKGLKEEEPGEELAAENRDSFILFVFFLSESQSAHLLPAGTRRLLRVSPLKLCAQTDVGLGLC